MANPNSVPGPHRGVDLVLGSSQGLAGVMDARQQLNAKREAEAFANSPINPLQRQMLELVMGGKKRIEAGEDPAQVAAELKQHPIAQQYLQAAKGGGLAAPAMGQAQPAQAPQQAAPQLETPPPPPAYPPGYGQSLGAPPRGPVSGALNMSPQPVTQAWDKLSAAPVSLGNTQPPRPEFGSQMQPAVSQRPAPQQAPVPQAPTAPPQYTQRDYASVQGMFPTLLAAQGRNDAAQIRADVQRENSIRQNDTATFKTMLQQRGMDADRASREAIEFAKLSDSERRNVLDNLTRVTTTRMNNARHIEVAGINADSREKVAATRAAGKGAGKDELGAQIKALRSQVSGLGRADTITAPKGTQEALDSARAQLKALESEWNKRNLGPLPPAPQPVAPPPTPSGAKIKVRLKNGKLGLISPQHFNPATMTKE